MDTIKTVITAAVGGLVVVALLFMSGKMHQEVSVGAVASPDIMSKYINIGGALLQTQAMTPIQATSTVVCSMQSPAATSSLLSAGAGFTTATSGASSLSISIGSAPYVVGTVLSTTTVAANAQGFISIASSTRMSPNTFVVIAQQGAGILNQSGNCSAIWHTP